MNLSPDTGLEARAGAAITPDATAEMDHALFPVLLCAE